MRTRRCQTRVSLPLILAAILFFALGCSTTRTFDGEAAYAHVQAQCDLGPRCPGSSAAEATREYIVAELEKVGCRVLTQEFSYDGVQLANIIGMMGEGKGPASLLGAHYDTRRHADSDPARPMDPVLGANDGGSGVAVLLELANCLDEGKLQNEVWFAFLDAEDQGGIDGWPWSVGATYMANNLPVVPDHVIIVDMVGDHEQKLHWERNSDTRLLQRIWATAEDLGYTDAFVAEYKYSIMDDHIPFLSQGIPAVDIIDLDYPEWHTIQDTPDKVSAASLMRVGRVLETLLEGEGISLAQEEEVE